MKEGLHLEMLVHAYRALSEVSYMVGASWQGKEPSEAPCSVVASWMVVPPAQAAQGSTGSHRTHAQSFGNEYNLASFRHI